MDRRKLRAHRAAYLFAVGEIPAGQLLRHSCDRPDCVNPAHLSPGTHRDNMDDRTKRNRQARGERNGRAKLNESIVAEIRLRSTGRYGEVRRLSREYGINHYVVHDILRGKTWRHVSPSTTPQPKS